MAGAPYRRGYHHTKSKGKESTVTCDSCGRMVPRWKTFASFRGFSITDPTLRKQLDRRFISSFKTKMYVCPACARYRHISKPGRSRKSRSSK